MENIDFGEFWETVKDKEDLQLTDRELEILLLDTYYLLENENMHQHLIALEQLTELKYVDLDKKYTIN